MAIAEFFWPKVAAVGNVCECWEWTAALNDGGYGIFRITGTLKNRRAHRLAYELLIGQIPVDLQLDHLCRNRSCVNPWHLEPVTQDENVRRGDAGKNPASQDHFRLKASCARGHEFTAENTYLRKDKLGVRMCRTCHRENQNRRYHAKKAAQ